MVNPKKKYKYPVYIFEWRDAQYDSDGTDPTEPFKPPVLTTVGFLIEDNKKEKYVKFCQEYAENESWVRHKNVIPHEMIVSCRKVTL